MFERIVIIDDQPADPDLLDSLGAEFAQTAVRTARSLEAGLGPTQEVSKRSLILLEPALRGRSGMQVLSRARTLRPEVPIAVRSANASRSAICAALNAGALGYFPKTMRTKLLVAGLRYVFAGGIFVPLEMLEEGSIDEPACPRGDRALTWGQTRVLRLLLTGRTNREIGRELNISEGTVKAHLLALYRTLGVTSRAVMIAAVATNALQEYGARPGGF